MWQQAVAITMLEANTCFTTVKDTSRMVQRGTQISNTVDRIDVRITPEGVYFVARAKGLTVNGFWNGIYYLDLPLPEEVPQVVEGVEEADAEST